MAKLSCCGKPIGNVARDGPTAPIFQLLAWERLGLAFMNEGWNDVQKRALSTGQRSRGFALAQRQGLVMWFPRAHRSTVEEVERNRRR